MKKLTLIMLAVILTSASSIALADFSADSLQSNFYIGVDAAKSFMKFKGGFGENVFAKNPYELTVSAGTKFSDMFGVEAGYTHQLQRKREVTLSGSESLPGIAGTLGATNKVRSKIRARHPYLGVFVDQPIIDDKTKIAALFAISLSRIKAEHEVFEVGGVTLSAAQIAGLKRTYKKTKAVPMIRLSASHDINERVAVRAFGLWRNMSRFKIKSSEPSVNGAEVRLKNSYSFGLGLTYRPF